MDDILATNVIEEIHSTSTDVFSVFTKTNVIKDKELIFITKSYTELMNKKDVSLKTLQDIRSIYDEVILPGIIVKENYHDGDLFRKNPVYVSNRLQAIHNGFYPDGNYKRIIIVPSDEPSKYRYFPIFCLRQFITLMMEMVD